MKGHEFMKFFSGDKWRNEIAGKRHGASGGIFKNIDEIAAYLFAAGTDLVLRGKLRMRRKKCW